jgi:bifunctional UDP-N-acetylglucosamine pyrophosphorylase/glucosamine-1-phosphate N-acetyltransferase
MENIGAIILAAGKGKRMQLTDKNKVTEELGGKPIIVHAVDLLEYVGVSPIIIVVGFAKESVRQILGERVLYAEQQDQLGTAHAAMAGLSVLPKEVTDVIIFNGDDSAFYSKDLIVKLIETHKKSQAAVTLLTLTLTNPLGLGRIKRDDKGAIIGVVEEKDATAQELEITEINPGCYVFTVEFLTKFLPNVEKSVTTHEYYLTSLIDLAVKANLTIATLTKENIYWRGVNTKEELEEARKMFESANRKVQSSN